MSSTEYTPNILMLASGILDELKVHWIWKEDKGREKLKCEKSPIVEHKRSTSQNMPILEHKRSSSVNLS